MSKQKEPKKPEESRKAPGWPDSKNGVRDAGSAHSGADQGKNAGDHAEKNRK